MKEKFSAKEIGRKRRLDSTVSVQQIISCIMIIVKIMEEREMEFRWRNVIASVTNRRIIKLESDRVEQKHKAR